MELVENAELLPQDALVDTGHHADAVQSDEPDNLHRNANEHDRVHDADHQGDGVKKPEGADALEGKLHAMGIPKPVAARHRALQGVPQHGVVRPHPRHPCRPHVHLDLAHRRDLVLDADAGIVVAQLQDDLHTRRTHMGCSCLLWQVALRELRLRIQGYVSACQPLGHGATDVAIGGEVLGSTANVAWRPVLLENLRHHVPIDAVLPARRARLVVHSGRAPGLQAVAHERVLDLIGVPKHQGALLLAGHKELVVQLARAPCVRSEVRRRPHVHPGLGLALGLHIGAGCAAVAPDEGISDERHEEERLRGLQVVAPGRKPLAAGGLVSQGAAVIVLVRGQFVAMRLAGCYLSILPPEFDVDVRGCVLRVVVLRDEIGGATSGEKLQSSVQQPQAGVHQDGLLGQRYVRNKTGNCLLSPKMAAPRHPRSSDPPCGGSGSGRRRPLVSGAR
mmetsp:Transcript_108153/g.312549  ORF Transcript_108153/g.312549 Transcript_108153/m.312549 type:complete len:448 (-) Transcript_108153:27-1370(-)